MGTIFKLPVVEPPSLREALNELQRLGVRCVAAHGPARNRSLAQCDLRGDCCIVLGSEGYGLSPAILEACSEHVAIPMAQGVDSLNVGNAAAVFLYEASRQRGWM
jgi:tRNA G18 (ribose-2'-O)-methylase SpoU